MTRPGFAAALASLALCATRWRAPPARAADKISIIVGGMEKQIYLPPVLCERLGFFKEQGLDVELINSRAGVEAENELLAGAVQGVVGFYDHTIDLQAKGKSIISVVQFSQAPGRGRDAVRQGRRRKTPADLKGKTLGVTGLGSSTDFLTRFIVTRAGLKAGEYTLLPVGAGNTFIAAMKQDQIQAGMTTEPTVGQLLKMGAATVMVDLRTPEKHDGGARRPLPGRLLLRAVDLARRPQGRGAEARQRAGQDPALDPRPSARARSPTRCRRTITSATRRST